jgi:DUF438 domain-containing protein
MKKKLFPIILIAFILLEGFYFNSKLNDIEEIQEEIQTDILETNVFTISKMEKMFVESYGELNDINKVSKSIKYILERYESGGNYETIEVDGYIFEENSYLYLLQMSIAFRESTYRNVEGKAKEIGYYQLLPSTLKYTIMKNKKDFIEGESGTFYRIWNDIDSQTYWSLNYIKYNLDRHDDILTAISMYNGDKTKNYGKRVLNTMKNIYS